MDWETLRSSCLACTRCELCKTRTNVVFGQGVEDAEVLFVGEGPGQSEDAQGLPFVGRSGQLLDKYLFAIDHDRASNCYIANIVKCRPPHNRDPQFVEQKCCGEWLQRQIALVDPASSVCLGRSAATALIKDPFRITREHGQWVKKGGFALMAMYHPAALLRDPARRPDAIEDLMSLREKVRAVCEHTPLPEKL